MPNDVVIKQLTVKLKELQDDPFTEWKILLEPRPAFDVLHLVECVGLDLAFPGEQVLHAVIPIG